MSSRTSERLLPLEPEVAALQQQLRKLAAAHGISFRVTSQRRDPRKQAELYARWRAGLSRFPVAPPGTSQHEFGLAFDAVSNNQAVLGRLGQTLGLVWTPRDAVHFALLTRAEWRQARLEAGGRRSTA